MEAVMTELTSAGVSAMESRDAILNSPFFLHRFSSVWLIAGAGIDLFLVKAADGEPLGSRRHVLRIGAGEAIFSFEAPLDTQYRILAVPLPGCRLGRVSLQGLEEHPILGPCAILILERWILRLAQAIAPAMAPVNALTLESGATVSVDDNAKAILPVQGVSWVSHEKGESRFLKLPSLDPITGSDPLFPVTRYTWLMASPGTIVKSVPRSGGCQPYWEGLRKFHRMAMSCLALYRIEAERNEIQRLKAQAEADLSRIGKALADLAAPLGRVYRSTPGKVSNTGALAAAAEAVGSAMGIKIMPHPDLIRGIQIANPVSAIARASKVRVRRVALKGKWWRGDFGPILAFRDAGNAPVALLPRSRNRYELYDPESGTTTLLNASLALKLNGFAYIFYQPFPSGPLTPLKLLAFGASRAHADIWTIAAMGTASGVLAVIPAIVTGILFDSVIPGAQRSQLVILTLFLIVTAVSLTLFNLTRSFATLRLEGRMASSIQAAVWDRLLALPAPFFRNYSSGDLAARSMGINQIHSFLTGSALSSILTGVFSIFSFALLFYYSVPLALLATLLTAVAFAVTAISGLAQVRRQREITRIRGRLSGMVLQFINGISKFRVSGTEHRAFVAWAGQFARQKQLSVEARNISNRLAAFNATFPVFSTAIIFYSAISMKGGSSQVLSTGELLAFLSAFTQFMMAALQLSAAGVGMLAIVPLYERAKPILQTPPEVDSAKANPRDFLGEIEVNHVAFRYRPDTPLILNDVTLSISPGQFVAIVGPSGCGKSTLFRILLGFEQPESGAIYYDRQDLSGLDLQGVRQQMGVVLQGSKLFTGSLFNNIVGSAPLTENDAWEAARLSGLDKDIENMPMGMHTMITAGGGGLSGGQKQRLLIARAIVRKPAILLFDEATSALDNKTQAIVSRSLERLRATRIVIAHRLSTIVNADKIFVLEGGKLVQQGPYEELMLVAGPFRDLARRQIA